MKVIDSHLHLDADKFPNIDDAVKALQSELEIASEIEKVIILHLEAQPWSAKEVSVAISRDDRLNAFVNIDPRRQSASSELEFAIKTLGFCGLKIHPRLQELDMKSRELVSLCQTAGALSIPVLVDAFPDGTFLMNGFNPLDYADLAKNCPSTKFIWAHMGGHHVLDLMMLAKRLPNVHFDCSYALLYFRGSSIPGDMIYAMNSMRFNRVFYGSDYPDRPLKQSLDLSLDVLAKHDVKGEALDRLLCGNIKELMGW